MAASVLQAGPMVQMILARRGAFFFGIESSSGLGVAGFNLFLDWDVTTGDPSLRLNCGSAQDDATEVTEALVR
jgi:hypothetical protein